MVVLSSCLCFFHPLEGEARAPHQRGTHHEVLNPVDIFFVGHALWAKLHKTTISANSNARYLPKVGQEVPGSCLPAPSGGSAPGWPCGWSNSSIEGRRSEKRERGITWRRHPPPQQHPPHKMLWRSRSSSSAVRRTPSRSLSSRTGSVRASCLERYGVCAATERDGERATITENMRSLVLQEAKKWATAKSPRESRLPASAVQAHPQAPSFSNPSRYGTIVPYSECMPPTTANFSHLLDARSHSCKVYHIHNPWHDANRCRRSPLGAKGRVRALLQGHLLGHCPAVRDEDRSQEHARQEPSSPEGSYDMCVAYIDVRSPVVGICTRTRERMSCLSHVALVRKVVPGIHLSIMYVHRTTLTVVSDPLAALDRT